MIVAIDEMKVVVIGKVKEFDFSHETHGEKFYKVLIEVKRLSEAVDTIPVIISEVLIGGIGEDVCLSVEGVIKTRNTDRKSLEVFVFAKAVEVLDADFFTNSVEFTGTVVRQPQLRKTPLGRDVCDLTIANNQLCGKCAYIPCVAWGRSAIRATKTFVVGTKVKCSGRFQSRNYIKKYEDGIEEAKVAYEVSLTRIEEVKADED